MRTLGKRIATLEEKSLDHTPYIVWQDGDVPPPIPDDIGDRSIMIVRWARTPEEATHDPSSQSGANFDNGDWH